MALHTASVDERFWLRVDKSGTCWLWTKCLDKDGYGVFSVRDGLIVVTHGAHQWSWILTYGSIPKGKLVLHKRNCHNRHCVNPEHLYLGTQSDNMTDRLALGHLVLHKRNALGQFISENL